MRREFRGPDRARITADWAAAFPGLGVRAPAAASPMLVRRAGPVVAGICLDRRTDTTVYCPTAFVHFLGTPGASITLTGATVPARPNGAPMIVRAGLHDREFPDAVARLRSAFPLDLDEPWSLDTVVGGCLDLANRETATYGPRMAGALLEMVALVPIVVAGDSSAGMVSTSRLVRSTAGLAWTSVRSGRGWPSSRPGRRTPPSCNAS